MTAYVLNLFDLACTYLFLGRGWVELNPVARWLQEIHPGLFLVCKVFLAGLLILWLEREARTEPLAQIAIRLVTGYYAAIAVYYIVIFAAAWLAV